MQSQIDSAEVLRLTGESTPAADVAGSAVGQDHAPGREAGGHDGVREGDGGRQLDKGDVVTAKGKQHTYSEEVMTTNQWFAESTVN